MDDQLSRTVSELQSRVSSLEREIESLQKVIEDTVSRTIDPDTLKAFKNLPYKMVCDSIKNLIARGTTLSLDEVESILKEWGFDLNNEKIGERIASSITPWIEPKHAIVPLKNVVYRDSDIMISLNDESVSIPAGLLPFATSAVLEKIKDIFEGNLKAFIDKIFYFQWNSKSNQLKIEEKYVVREKINVDSASLKIFEKIKILYEQLKEKYGPFPMPDIIIGGITGIKTKEIKGRGEIPHKFLRKDPEYNPKCAEILVGMADICYITDRDLWFKIGDVLIWEEPRYSKATYIFEWPEEPLQVFIFITWSLTLEFIRDNPRISDYKDRAFHRSDVLSWKRNLKNKM